MPGDFDISDEDYAADVVAIRLDMQKLSKALRVANPPHPAPEVEEPPRDAQPARLTLGEP